MHYVTLFIDSRVITCCLTMISRRETVVIDKHVIYVDEFDEALTLWMAKWVLQSSKNIPCRIILAEEYIMQRGLQLPNLDLSADEIDAYVKNSLVKIFHTEESLFYDYKQENKQLNALSTSLLSVYACQHQLITKYQCIVHLSLKIHFIGIPDCLLNRLNVQNDIDVTPIICSPSLVGINFLPWRAQLKKQKRQYFLLQVLGGLLLLFFVFLGLICASNQRLNQQKTQYQIMQDKNQWTKQQLSSLIALERKNEQLKIDLSQQYKQTHLFMLLNCLQHIATSIPSNVWLDSLEYQNNIMNLKGRAFLHEDILTFVNELNRNDPLQLSNIITIKRQDFLLYFHLDFHFDKKGIINGDD